MTERFKSPKTRRATIAAAGLAAVVGAATLTATPAEAQVQGNAIVERTNVQSDTPGVFVPALIVTFGGQRSVHLLGEDGLTREIYWDDGAVLDWVPQVHNREGEFEAASDRQREFGPGVPPGLPPNGEVPKNGEIGDGCGDIGDGCGDIGDGCGDFGDGCGGFGEGLV